MSKGIFRSHNKVGETMSFQISTSNIPPLFTPTVTKTDGGRVSWDLDNSLGYSAGNSVSYTYPGPVSTKNITLRTNLLSTLNSINLDGDNVIGHLDLSGWSGLFKNVPKTLDLSNNTGLTGVTHTYTPYKSSTYNIIDCDLRDTLDLRPLGDMGGNIRIESNSNLTRILFSGDTGTFGNLFFNDNDLVELDFSTFKNFATQFKVDGNSNLTGLTFYTAATSSVNTTYFLTSSAPNYVGNIDLRGLKLEDYFDVRGTKCNQILHGYNNGVWDKYWASNCDITGNHDLTMFPTLGNSFSVYNNIHLTGITHTASTAEFTSYEAYNCDLQGNHDLSMFPNLGGNFNMSSNSGLTSVTHVFSPQVFTAYNLSDCGLDGTLTLPFSELGGDFNVHDNGKLTKITHSATTNAFTSYKVDNCKLTGILDLSLLSKLGGSFECDNNLFMSGINHGSVTNTEVFTKYKADTCNLGGVLDVSMLTNLGGSFNVSTNVNLKNVLFPTSTQTFANSTGGNYAFTMNGCNFTGNNLSFLPLSGATMDVNSALGASIILDDSGLDATDVNFILNSFKTNVLGNFAGWSGVTLSIAGSNAAPDTTSGGINGISARNTITGSPYNWIVTTN